MSTAIATDDRANLVGSLWMIAAMAAFATEDTFIKLASAALPVGQIMILFGVGGALLFAVIARLSGQPLFSRAVLSGPMRLRVVFEIIGRLFYTLAVVLTPLSSATVIVQATPLVVVAGAGLVFGERVDWRRWAAIFVGLSGVIVIVQPGTDAFSMLSILAVLGMLGFAGRDLASRAAPPSIGTAILGLYGFLAVVLAGVMFSLWDGAAFVMPSGDDLLLVAGATLAGVTAYACLMKAMRTGAVSAVTPFRYTRLLFGLGFGVVFFDERLSPAMILGGALIVVSGIFILWRGKARGPKGGG